MVNFRKLLYVIMIQRIHLKSLQPAVAVLHILSLVALVKPIYGIYLIISRYIVYRDKIASIIDSYRDIGFSIITQP